MSHSDEDHIDLFEILFGLNANLLRRVGLIVLGDHFENYFRVESTKAFIRDFVLRVLFVERKIHSLSHDIRSVDLRGALAAGAAFTMPTTAPRRAFAPQTLLPNVFFSPLQLALPGTLLEILGANAGAGDASKEKDTNANSAVVRLNINGKNILIMGDATGHTTDKILSTIGDPNILRAELLVSSHHGAENEEANHIAWVAITAPKHIAISNGFNTGYKHPTIAAVTNFLATGQVEERSFESPLVPYPALLTDTHFISVFNVFGPHVLRLAPQIRGLETLEADPSQFQWVRFSTRKSIYSTGSSGSLRYTFSKTGILVDFNRER